MKTVFTLLSSLFLSFSISGQSWLWAYQSGGNGYDDGNAIAVDAAGNSYVTGTFQDTAVFGSISLISTGDNDVFTAKFSPTGNCIWAKKGGGIYADGAYGLCIDVAGNVYITGYYNAASITFGSFTLATATWDDIFVVKYNNSGVEQWAVKAGGGGNDYGYGLASDGANYVYLVGNFESSSSFGTNSLSSGGWGDIVVAKYDVTNGACVWATKGGGSGNDGGNGITIGGSNIYVTGFFRGTGTFGTQPTLTSAGFDDFFIGKLDMATGTWAWAKKGGGTQNDGGLALSADGVGNCYVTGYYEGTGTFGTNSLITAGIRDIFLIKYDAAGTILFAKSHGGWGNDQAYGITRDPVGDLVLVGSFEGTATFDASTLVTTGIGDIFVAKCSPTTGNASWAVLAGGIDDDKALGVGMDAMSNVYATGYFRDNCSFPPVEFLDANVYDEIFLAKLTYPVGMAEENTIDFSLSPNPAGSTIYLNMGSFNEEWTAQVYDYLGREVIYLKDQGNATIDLGELASGTYMLNVYSKGKNYSGHAKFVKIR